MIMTKIVVTEHTYNVFTKNMAAGYYGEDAEY